MGKDIFMLGRITEVKLKQGGIRVVIEDVQVEDLKQLQAILEIELRITVIPQTSAQQNIDAFPL